MNGRQRLGTLKLKSGDPDGAMEDFRVAVADGADADQVANAIFGLAFSNHFQAQQLFLGTPASINVGEVAQALELFDAAAEFAQAPAIAEQIHFFLAFGYYLQGSAYDGRNEDDEACGPARNALNAFQRVSAHLGEAGSYQADSQRQIREAIDVQLYRQETIIESACSR
ncbi:hypothetical protein [Candidatus Palauibacter sp.]|uniref:hypothetical protein n=1 Tax=Candidatus Palauibacter sp. TaxID=3101350 RepID=UPI003B5C3185